MSGARLSWRSACLSMSGRRSKSRGNEDAYLDWPAIAAWAVADGMGGHARGGEASRLAIEAIGGAIRTPELEPEPGARGDRRQQILRKLAGVNRSLVALGAGLQPPGIVGCTVAGLVIEGAEARLFWVGDSRAYLLRDRALHQLTEDHARLVPWVDPAEPEAPPRPRQMLTQAIGAQPGLSIATKELALTPGDRLLLCTDGFYKHFSEEEIARHLSRPVERIVEAVWQDIARRGASDDTTFIAIEPRAAGRAA
ncbi:serine/threonine phosphoprotein phosphatase Stp1 [Acidisoma sp. C75]